MILVPTINYKIIVSLKNQNFKKLIQQTIIQCIIRKYTKQTN